MHEQAMNYVAWARDQCPMPGRVLELGSYNVNGSVRALWPANVGWYGIDVRPGPGVNEVADARDYDGNEEYDLVICTEMMEHCKYANRVLKSAYKSLKPGGNLIATMAGEGRAPHNGDGDPFDHKAPGAEWYANVTEASLRRWCRDAKLLLRNLEHDPVAGDLRCIAWKSNR